MQTSKLEPYVWSAVYVDALLLRDTFPANWTSFNSGIAVSAGGVVVGSYGPAYGPASMVFLARTDAYGDIRIDAFDHAAVNGFWSVAVLDGAMDDVKAMGVGGDGTLFVVDGTRLDIVEGPSYGSQNVINVYSLTGVHPDTITVMSDGSLLLAGDEGMTHLADDGTEIATFLYASHSMAGLGTALQIITVSSENAIYLLADDSGTLTVAQFDEGLTVCVDANVIYAIGTVITAVLDANANATILSDSGGTIYLSHYDQEGYLLWYVNPGLIGNLAMNVEPDGAVMLYGYDDGEGAAALIRYAKSDGGVIETLLDTRDYMLAQTEFAAGIVGMVNVLGGGVAILGYAYEGLDLVAYGEIYNPGQRFYAQQDASWNTTAIVDSNGVVGQRFLTTPYGEVTAIASDASIAWCSPLMGWTVTYKGGRYDVELAVFNFRNREYNVGTETWLTPEPYTHGYIDGLGLYQPFASNPLGRVDPLGLQAENCPVATAAYVTALESISLWEANEKRRLLAELQSTTNRFTKAIDAIQARLVTLNDAYDRRYEEIRNDIVRKAKGIEKAHWRDQFGVLGLSAMKEITRYVNKKVDGDLRFSSKRNAAYVLISTIIITIRTYHRFDALNEEFRQFDRADMQYFSDVDELRRNWGDAQKQYDHGRSAYRKAVENLTAEIARKKAEAAAAWWDACQKECLM